jgi:putative transposase
MRIKYGALKDDEAQRPKALEQRTAAKRIVAEQALDVFSAERWPKASASH